MNYTFCFCRVNSLHLEIVPVLYIGVLVLDIILDDNKLVSFYIVPKALNKNSVQLFMTDSLSRSNVVKINTIELTHNQKGFNFKIREKTLSNY